MTATLLGISPLAWFLIAFEVGSVAFGYFIGWFIHGAERPVPARERSLPSEPESAVDLDDWLAAEGPLLDFKVWKRPCASTRNGAVEGRP